MYSEYHILCFRSIDVLSLFVVFRFKKDTAGETTICYSEVVDIMWPVRLIIKHTFCSSEVKEEFLPKPPPMDYTTTFKGDFTKGVVVYQCNTCI